MIVTFLREAKMLAIFCVLGLICLLLKVKLVICPKNKGPQKWKDIPHHSYISNKVKFPKFIEAIYCAIFFVKDGLQLVSRTFNELPENEPIVKLQVLTNYVMVVKGPALIHAILGSNDKRLLTKPKILYQLFFQDELRNGLFASEMAIWEPHRKVLSKCFTYKSLQSYMGILNKNGRELVKDLLSHCDENETCSNSKFINDQICLHLLNIICEVLMGPDKLNKEEKKTRRLHFIQSRRLAMYKAYNPLNFLPFVWRLNPKRKVYEEHRNALKGYFTSAIENCKRKLESKNHSVSTSIVEEMLLSGGSDIEICSEVETFLIGGHDSTVTAVKLFLQHIAENVDIQRKCQVEVDSIFDLKAGKTSVKNKDLKKELTMNDVSTGLKYLERCILETLRITAVAPLIFRQLSAPMDIEGYHFEKGTTFLFPIWSVHKDPKNFPEPNKFDPDRFLAENTEGKHGPAFLPFSLGPRNCIGFKFAMMELKVILSWILRHFHVSTKDRLEDMQFQFAISTVPVGKYNFTFYKRQNNLAG